MANLNLSTVELVSTPLVVPTNGAASSSDFNDNVKGILADLASLATMVNSSLLPLVNSLQDKALLPVEAPVGVEGRTIFTDTSDKTQLFFDSLNNTSLTVADSIRLVNSILNSFQTQVNDITVQIAAVQTKLAADNRNNIASALQNLTNSLAQVSGSVSTNSASIASHEARLSRFKSKRVTTGAINPGDNGIIIVTWNQAFVDNNYTVNVSLEDNAGDLRVLSFNYLGTGTALEVQVTNTGAAAVTGNVHVIAHYDPENA